MADASKLEKIIKEIDRQADNQVSKIKKETAAYLRTELRKAESQAKQEIGAAQFTLQDRLTEQMNADLSAAEKAETQALLRRRAEITDEVFAEARRRIEAFTESDAYAPFLKSSAERIRAATVLLKLWQDGEIVTGEEEEDALSAAIREFRETDGRYGNEE